MNIKVSNTVDKTLGKVMRKWESVIKTVNPTTEIVHNEEQVNIAPFETVWLTRDNRIVFKQSGQLPPKTLDELNVHELRVAAALADNLAELLKLKDEPNAITKATSLLNDYDSCAWEVAETDLISALRSVINEVA